MSARPRMCPRGCGAYAAEADVCLVCGGRLIPSLIGQTFGTYQAERLLGLGSSGASVWEARSFVDDSLVALKVACEVDPAESRRVRSAAARMSGLHHPNLNNLLDHGDSDRGEPWLALDLLRGPTLSSLLQQRGALTLPQALHIASEVLAALYFLHDRGLVHRDIKPANIHLSANHGAPWTVRVLDFGLVADRTSQAHELANPIDLGAHPGSFGVIEGTPEYMAPEQVLGLAVDHRADLYALGVVLYRLVTGHLPFGDLDRHSLYLAHLRARPLPALAPEGELPVPLVELISSALAKQPRDRIATAGRFLDTLSSI